MDGISIIVRTKNEESAIGIVLERILSQEVGMPVEVIVVDSGSTDSTVEIAKKYTSGIFHIPAEKFSYGYALNYGIERASGPIIVNVSAHCLPADNSWLRMLVAPIVNGSAHATFGRQVPVPGVNPFEEVSLKKHFPDHEMTTGRVPFSNANCAFLKSLWNELGFDETIPSWEDYLWFSLLRNKYIFSYVPTAAVRHSHPFSLRSVLRRSFNDGAAFRVMKDRYHIDLIGELAPSVQAKLRFLMNDIMDHFKFFVDKKYVLFIPAIPFVRILTFKAYRDGYNSAEKTV